MNAVVSLGRLSLTPALSQREREQNIAWAKVGVVIEADMKDLDMADELKALSVAVVFSLSLWERVGVRERGGERRLRLRCRCRGSFLRRGVDAREDQPDEYAFA
jgi:hypothetical protein